MFLNITLPVNIKLFWLSALKLIYMVSIKILILYGLQLYIKYTSFEGGVVAQAILELTIQSRLVLNLL